MNRAVPDPGALPRVRVWPTLKAALGLLQRMAGRLAPFWLAALATYVVVGWTYAAVAAHATTVAGAWLAWATFFAASVVYALVTAAAVRLLMAADGPVGRLDSGLAVYVAVRTALGVGGNLLILEGLSLPYQLKWAPADAFTPLPLLLGVAGWLLAEWISVRVMLWPIARLIGDRRVGFGLGWRAMGGATLPTLLASIVLGGPLVLVSIVAMALFTSSHAWGGLVVGSAAAVLTLALGVAVAAVVYRVRLGDEAAKVVSVFD